MRLGRVQAEILRRVVMTNGGGIYVSGAITRTMLALERKGLVQGKRGSDGCAVHTREGLEWVRKNPAPQETLMCNAICQTAQRAAAAEERVKRLEEMLESIVHFSDGFVVYHDAGPLGEGLRGWINAARAALQEAPRDA